MLYQLYHVVQPITITNTWYMTNSIRVSTQMLWRVIFFRANALKCIHMLTLAVKSQYIASKIAIAHVTAHCARTTQNIRMFYVHTDFKTFGACFFCMKMHYNAFI